MRKLDVSAVSNSIGLPVKSGTVMHMQNAYVEAVAESIKGLIGSSYSPATLYVLQGMVNSGSGLTYNITSGSCFYNGEVYICDGASFTATAPNIGVCTVNTTFFTAPNADGVQFTDGNVRNIHQIRKMVVSAGLAGSGVSNYADVVRINTNVPPVNLLAGTGIGVTGTYPNITITNTLPNANKVLACRRIYIGDFNTTPSDPYTVLLSGGGNGQCAYLHTFPTPIPTGNYFIVAQFGNWGHDTLSKFNDNYMCLVQIGTRSQTQFYFALMTTATGNSQAAEITYFVYSLD